MNTNLICHALIRNSNGDFLIMRRSQDESVLAGYWDIPGGSLDGRESPLECIIREAQEEAGSQVNNPDLAFHTSNIDGNKNERFVRLIFIANSKGDNVELGKEHDAYEWVNPKTAVEEYKLVDYLKECLQVIVSRSHQLSQLSK